MAERAGIARSILYSVEKGDAGVAMGAYFNVLRVLGLQGDFSKRNIFSFALLILKNRKSHDYRNYFTSRELDRL